MKKAITLTLTGLFLFSIVFAGAGIKVHKNSPLLNQGKYLVPQEKAPSGLDPNTGVKFNYEPPRSMNAALVDSSSNGYGMVVTSTRPIDEDDGNWIITYRQYAGEGTTHGQLGAAFTDDIEENDDWTVYTNVNSNGNPEWGGGGVCEDGTCAQARYPSAVASPDYPYAIWNEYTAAVSTYGGRPYYTYDEFGWDGDSFAYPLNIDLLWGNAQTDQWVGSAQYSYNEDDDMGVINVVYNDWTRNNTYLFHSEVIEDGIVIFGTEQIGLDLLSYFGPDGYQTSPLMAMNDNGQGAMGVVGLFNGNDPEAGTCVAPAADISCNHIPIFKLTDDHGYTWYGPSDGSGLGHYWVPDAVFDDIFINQIAPGLDDANGDGVGDTYNSYCTNYGCNADDDCTLFDVDYDGDGVTEITELAGSEEILIDGWWAYYNWDMRVDSEGDVHILMTYVPGGAEFLYFLDNASGYYHITIDKDHIDAPGDINTPEGWNWSLVMPGGSDAWSVDADNDTYAEIWDSHANLSFSNDDPDVVWAVFNMPTTGAYISETVEQNATSCGQWDTFIPSPADLDNWSFDIYVAKSTDGGMTWSDAENVSNTSGDFSNGAYDGPEEMYPHTPAFSTDDSVTIMYQVPNWAWNEIGDPTSADHMNYVYVGNASVEGLSNSDNDSSNNGPAVPSNFELTQNYPNPFNPSTTIDFSVPNLSDVNISVYDINGRLVKTLMNNTLTSGTYSVVWNGDDVNGNTVSAGIYMYSLTSDETSITNKMILVK